MNTTAELTMYQEALRAEGTAILRWDLNADRVYGDELLQGVIPEKLKNESYSAFLLQSLRSAEKFCFSHIEHGNQKRRSGIFIWT